MTEEQFKELIDSLKVDIRLLEDMIQEVSSDIINEGFSSHPVFIATEHEIKIGELIASKDEFASRFNIYASTLEELVDKSLVKPDRKNEFIKAYKDPGKFACIMLVTAEIASYVFLPFQKQD